MNPNDRRSGIGASESAPIVLGRDRFGRTAADVYAAKVLDPREFSTQAMARGNFLEAGILAWYEHETDRVVSERQPRLRSTEHDWLTATPDGLLPDRVVEAKTARSREGWGEPGSNEIPLEYLIQTTHQMLVTGRRQADVPVLFGNLEFALYVVPFERDLAELIVAETGQFWREHVLPKVPPAPRSGSDCELLYRRDNGALQVATPEIAALCRDLAIVREQIDALEETESARIDAIKASMGEAAYLVDAAGARLASWKSNKDSSVFDTNRFKAEHPELHAQYRLVKPGARVFRLTVTKDPSHESAEPARLAG